MTLPEKSTPELDVRSIDPRFQSAAIYDLVARLRISSYEDLLAPHWTVADSARAVLPLDATRFLRAGSAARVHLVALPRAGDLTWDSELAEAQRRTTALLPPPPAASPGVPAPPAAASDPLRLLIAALRRYLWRLFGRS